MINSHDGKEAIVRSFVIWSLVATLVNSAGCSMCCSPYDLEYATYGTGAPRIDQVHGRSGSPFSDSSAGGTVQTSENDIQQYDALEGNEEVSSEHMDGEPMMIEAREFEEPLQFE